jgi:helicase
MLSEAPELTPPQAYVLSCHLLESGFNCLLQMATGSGKTWLAEYAMRKTLMRGGRAIYLAATRALAQELLGRWTDRFSGQAIGIFTGDYGRSGNAYPISFEQSRVLIMTPERLDACTRHWRGHWGWLPEVDLLVVDEFHLLGEGNRGARLEGCLCRFRRLNPFARLLGLSATLGNRDELADWLGGVEFSSDWRPIPLSWHISTYRKAEEKPSITATEVKRITETGGKSLIFVQSRRRAENLATWLCAQGFKAAHHHAGLGLSERQSVEKGFREHQFEVLVTTSTLEVGINLPVRQVVLYDLQSFEGDDYRPLAVNQVWQRVGRAGRPGLDSAGEAVLIAPHWDRRYAEAYQAGQFEPIRSRLGEPRALTEQIIAEVSAGLCRTRSELNSALALTLAARQTRLPPLNPLINELCQAGMLSESVPDTDTDAPSKLRLKATPLGRIAACQMLSPTTVLLFRRVTEQVSDLLFFDLLLLAASSEDCEPTLPVDYEELEDLSAALSSEPTKLLQLGPRALNDILGIRGLRLLAAIKIAIVVRAWTRESDVDAVGARFNCYPFEIHRLRESMERLMSALGSCLRLAERTPSGGSAEIRQECQPTLFEKVTALQNMIQAGLDESTITLTLIPGLGPKIAQRLSVHGIRDIEDLAQCEQDDLRGIGGISSKRAARWIEAAEELMTSHTFRHFEESKTGLVMVDWAWLAGVDPYRLRRALELHVRRVRPMLYQVTGGADPHRVERHEAEFRCDCPDAGKGNLCKHVIAVRLAQRDPIFLQLRDRLEANNPSEGIDLLSLWFDSKRRN